MVVPFPLNAWTGLCQGLGWSDAESVEKVPQKGSGSHNLLETDLQELRNQHTKGQFLVYTTIQLYKNLSSKTELSIFPTWWRHSMRTTERKPLTGNNKTKGHSNGAGEKG